MRHHKQVTLWGSTQVRSLGKGLHSFYHKIKMAVKYSYTVITLFLRAYE